MGIFTTVTTFTAFTAVYRSCGNSLSCQCDSASFDRPVTSRNRAVGLRCRLELGVPAGEYQNGRMTLERSREDLRPLYAEIDPAILDGRDGGLRDAAKFGELALAQFLQFAKNPDRFPDGNLDALLGWTILFHTYDLR